MVFGRSKYINVREFEVDPNTRGETHSAGKNSSSLFPDNKNSAKTIFLKLVKFLTLIETFDIAIYQSLFSTKQKFILNYLIKNLLFNFKNLIFLLSAVTTIVS